MYNLLRATGSNGCADSITYAVHLHYTTRYGYEHDHARERTKRCFDEKLSPGSSLSSTTILYSATRTEQRSELNRSTINDRLNTIGRLLEESGGRRRDATARSIHRSIRDASRLDVEQPDASGRDRATKAQPRSARTRQRTTDRYPHPQLGFK